MQETSGIEARLRQATALPDVLAASFDAFEVIRLLARDCEDRVPALFAAFMTAADAAVDGREAITAAPSLAAAGAQAQSSVSAAAADPGETADSLAALGALLRRRLSCAGPPSATTGDLAACGEAAEAAGRICRLMSRGGERGVP